MSTDSYFLATGGSGIESGIAAYANPGFSFDVGVVGLGGVIGVTGGIDDGVNNPFAGLPARAVYSVSAAIVGGAASVPGVAGYPGASASSAKPASSRRPFRQT